MNKKNIINKNESPIRKTIHFKDYKSLNNFLESKKYKNSYLIMEGDWGGQIYLTFPVRLIKCDFKTLVILLKILDRILWKSNKGEGTAIYFERKKVGEEVPGGMGGGKIMPKLWIHDELKCLKTKIIFVLEGKLKLDNCGIDLQNKGEAKEATG